MSAFFKELDNYGAAIAVRYQSVSGQILQVSYSELHEKSQAFAEKITQQRSLVLLLSDNNIETLIAYIACLQACHAVMLLDANINKSRLEDLKKCYQPNYIVDIQGVEPYSTKQHKLDEQLALLLSTSGSTGSPKQVALSYLNLQSNAENICRYLPIHSMDTTLTTLPFNYSYGLSIINTHLLKGATIFLSTLSVVDKTFWQIMDEAEITSIAGVPYSYEMLIRLGLHKKDLPYLRYFTQAGGRLAEKKYRCCSITRKSIAKSFM